MSKKLVLYFSVYGTSKTAAEEIAAQTDADLIEIIPEIAYDSNRNHYDNLAIYAKNEHDKNIRPAIKNASEIKRAIVNHEEIFIGYPMWWYTFPMIIYTLLEENNFNGKIIIPFNTHMGSRDGGTYRTIEKMTKGAKVLKGKHFNMNELDGGRCPRKEIAEWIKELGI